jgi:tetratricopeptide (TPR) repeat protein
MVEQDSTQTQKRCIACREKIASDASICPKCRSSQKLQWWTNLLSVFKWIGGFTALISLIIGVKQVGSIITQWKEKDKTIEEIVVSSEMLVEMKDYPTAWKIIQKAASIDAGSNRAFNQQVDIAMEWLRNIWLQKHQKEFTKSIEPLILTLSQSVGTEDTNRAASILAHLGWANILRLKDGKAVYEVNSYLERALKLNPNDVYALMFKGYWLLVEDSSGVEDNLLSEAIKLFNKALKTNGNDQFVREWSIIALTESNLEGTDIEAFKLVNNWRKEGLSPEGQLYGEYIESKLLNFDPHLSEKSFVKRIMRDFSVNDIRDTYLWIVRQNLSQPENLTRKTKLNLGILSEASGDLISAFKYYASASYSNYPVGCRDCPRFKLERITKELLNTNEDDFLKLFPEKCEGSLFLSADSNERKILSSNGISIYHDSIFAIRDLRDGTAKKAGFMIGDIILLVDNIFLDQSNYNNIFLDVFNGKKPFSIIVIVREDNFICYKVEKEAI